MLLRRVTAVILLSFLAGCKLQIIVPLGGQVITDSGTYSCAAGQTCEIDIVDLFFDETFTAVPDTGYIFVQWKKKAGRGFCATVNQRHSPCRLYTAFIDKQPKLRPLLASSGIFFLVPEFTEGAQLTLNDTGITFGADYPFGNNVGCTGATISQQDCSNGRDASNNDDSDGHAGFSYTKLSTTGAILSAAAADFSCVRDNNTGLVWEAKTDLGGIHNEANTYRWGGKTALGSGWGEYYSDWNVLVDGSNTAALCGYADWRVPTTRELESLVNLNRDDPTIDTTFFVHTAAADFWSASPAADGSGYAWHVNFDAGYSYDWGDRETFMRVRLVSTAK